MKRIDIDFVRLRLVSWTFMSFLAQIWLYERERLCLQAMQPTACLRVLSHFIVFQLRFFNGHLFLSAFSIHYSIATHIFFCQTSLWLVGWSPLCWISCLLVVKKSHTKRPRCDRSPTARIPVDCGRRDGYIYKMYLLTRKQHYLCPIIVWVSAQAQLHCVPKMSLI